MLLVVIGVFGAALTAFVSQRSTRREVARLLEVVNSVKSGSLAVRASLPHSSGFRSLAESINGMIGELEDASSQQARFVSDVTHELRTPLATVRMAADYIHAGRTSLPPDAQRAAVLLERELERFENLLEDLLEITRFDAGEINLEPVEVDLGALLEDVFEAVEATALSNRVHLTLNIGPSDKPPIVAGDPRQLFLVFLILTRNAIQHTTDGSVRTRVATRDSEVVVRLEDDGEGIPEGDLPHIFERFYRADVHRARTLGGTGLGLAKALEYVTLHKGHITAESNVGSGSTFTVSLPGLNVKPKSPSGPSA